MPIMGKVVAERSGHIMHAGLMSKLLRVRSAWDIVDMPARVSSKAAAHDVVNSN
jgi:UDP-3-O-acyl-N-acetylglucosamine deacetylase